MSAHSGRPFALPSVEHVEGLAIAQPQDIQQVVGLFAGQFSARALVQVSVDVQPLRIEIVARQALRPFSFYGNAPPWQSVALASSSSRIQEAFWRRLGRSIWAPLLIHAPA